MPARNGLLKAENGEGYEATTATRTEATNATETSTARRKSTLRPNARKKQELLKQQQLNITAIVVYMPHVGGSMSVAIDLPSCG